MGNYYSGDPRSLIEAVGSSAVLTAPTDDDSVLYFDMTEYEYMMVASFANSSTSATLEITLRDATDSSGTGAADFEPTGDAGATAPSQTQTFTAANQSALFAFRLHGARQFVGVNLKLSAGNCGLLIFGVRAANQRQVPAALGNLATVFTVA